jgi:hypothetical protein
MDSIDVTLVNPLRYAAKFVCGKAEGAGTAPGRYFTAVNVHNPSQGTVEFEKRFSVALSHQKAGPLTRFVAASLGADRSFQVECEEILERTATGASLVEGFMVVRSAMPLDVVAIYSAVGDSGRVETLAMLDVEGERLPLELADLVAEGRCDLSVVVRNLGNGDAGASTTTILLGGKTFEMATPPIVAGGEVTLPPPLGGGASGDFGFTVFADSKGVIAESSENNNSAATNCIG